MATSVHNGLRPRALTSILLAALIGSAPIIAALLTSTAQVAK